MNFSLRSIQYNKEQVEKIALFVLIGTAVVAGFWFALFSPGFRKVSTLKKKCTEMNLKIVDAQDKIRNAPKIKERYTAYEARMRALQECIPEESDTSWIVETIGTIEKDLKFKTEKIVPYSDNAQPGAESVGENPLYAYRFALINLKAGYHQIGNFVNTLEKKVKYLQIITISIVGDKDSPYQHTVEIRIKYPVLKQPLVE